MDCHQTAPNLPRLLTSEDVCATLHVSHRTLNRWMRRGVISFSRIGKSPLFQPEDVAAAVQRARVDNRPA